MMSWIVISLSLNPMYGQSGFNQTYNTGLTIRFLSVGIDDGTIYLSGFYLRDTSAFQSGFVAAYDTLGDLKWWKEIYDYSSHISVNKESGLHVRQGKGIAVQYVYLNRNSIGIAFFDTKGNMQFIQEYAQEPGVGIFPTDIIGVSDGYLVTGSMSRPPMNQIDAFILKTDLAGEKQWLRVFGHPVYAESSRTITVLDENEYLISGSRFQYDRDPVFSLGWALSVDSLGSKLWEWQADSNNVPYRSIMDLQYDASKKEWVYFTFIERPTTYPEEDYLVRVPVLVHRDSAMNLISYKEYGPYAIQHYMASMAPSRDGGWIAAGRYTTTTDDFVSPISTRSGRVIKISSDDSLVWSVIDTAFFHPEIGSRSFLSGVAESESGSVYAVGWASNFNEEGTLRSYGWLLKITSDGCIDTLCTTTALLDQILDRQTLVKVYPNPASDYLTVELSEDFHDVKYIVLYDLTGRLVLKNEASAGINSLDLRYLVSGFYMCAVVDSQGQTMFTGKVVVN